jgi:hypothetical protein
MEGTGRICGQQLPNIEQCATLITQPGMQMCNDCAHRFVSRELDAKDAIAGCAQKRRLSLNQIDFGLLEPQMKCVTPFICVCM